MIKNRREASLFVTLTLTSFPSLARPHADTASLRAGDIERFFVLASELHATLHAEKMIKDRRYHLKVYKKCVKGNDLVSN